MGIDLSTYKGQNSVAVIKQEKKSFMTKEISFSNKFSDKKKERFYKELAILIQSGIDFKHWKSVSRYIPPNLFRISYLAISLLEP